MAASFSSLEDYARTILLGARLEDKLVTLPAPMLQALSHAKEIGRTAPLLNVPSLPGRPPALARFGKAEFPKLDRLAHDPTARGRVLHFFANHELLALELMALVLLRFPEAPAAFRAGLARTISEEQNHMRLYITRMRELGVEFGDLPLSDYFWKAIKDVASPLQFVTQMSLTLEQANLDYSLFYMNAIELAGDTATAGILRTVYFEEIGHVKHGLHWFNRWREKPQESDWDAYLRLLPPPMTPRRAKGVEFAAAPRREAGLSERFIQELEVYGGSKGRPPTVWLYNPLCESEIARGKPGFVGAESVRRLGWDLEPLLMQLASSQDVVLTQELPDTAWLKSMNDLGFGVPEFRQPSQPLREAKIGGLEPWGWSPEVFERFKPWRDRLVPTPGANGPWAARLLGKSDFSTAGIGPLYSKCWSASFFRDWLALHPEDHEVFGPAELSTAQICVNWEEARAAVLARLSVSGALCLVKAPWGTSGTRNKKILAASELDGSLGGWIRNTIQEQGAILIEAWLDKVADLSMQIEIKSDDVHLLGIRRFYVGSRLEYRGTELDSKLTSLDQQSLRFLHSDAQPLERWKSIARAAGKSLAQLGYEGPAGLDAMLWRNEGKLYLKPLVELNPRWTMGRVALGIEARVLPGTPARWVYVSRRELAEGQDFADLARELSGRHPARQILSGGRLRISEGIVPTTDPARAREVLTFLGVGPAACAEKLLHRP